MPKYIGLVPMHLKQSLFVRCIVGVAPNSLLCVIPPPYSEAKIQKFQVKEFSNKEFFLQGKATERRLAVVKASEGNTAMRKNSI